MSDPARPPARLRLGFLLVAAVSSYLVLQTYQLAPSSQRLFVNLAHAGLAGIGLLAVAGWAFLRPFDGVLAAILGSVAAIMLGSASGRPTLFLQIPVMAAASWFGWHLARMVKGRLDAKQVRLDQLEEEINLAKHEIQDWEQALEAIRRRRTKYDTLSDFARSLSQLITLPDIATYTVTKTSELIGPVHASLFYQIDPVEMRLLLLGSKRAPGIAPAAADGDRFDRWIFKQRQVLLVEDLEQDFRFSAEPPEPVGPPASRESGRAGRTIRSVVGSPVVSQQKLLGIIRLDSDQPKVFGLDELRLLSIMAELVAVSMENALLYHRTEELAIRDSLTGLYLFRHAAGLLGEALKRASRERTPVSILMLDLDGFKQYNDRYGHSAGDLLLKHVAHVIVEAARPHGVVARYGGDEFVVLLPAVEKTEAQAVGQRLLDRIGHAPFEFRRVQTGITISVGVVGYPDDGRSVEELVREADHQLYEAKRAGKNRLCMRPS